MKILGYDLFPSPFCVAEHGEGTCTFLGLEQVCLPSFDPNGAFASGVELGHLFTFIGLVLIGLFNFSYVSWPLHQRDAMKITTSFYSFITGFFALFRWKWGLGRLLLVGAALHNLAEWSIVAQISDSNKDQATVRKMTLIAVIWIIAVCMLVVMMPTLPEAILVEQTTGIMLDFALVFVFNKAYWIDHKSFYYLPMIAHTIHLFFTILPLVYANFFVGDTSWAAPFFLEVSVYISAPITHLLDLHWGIAFDAKAREDGVIPEKQKISKMSHYLVAGFIVGFIVLVGSPIIIGTCIPTPACDQSPIITGTSVAQVHPGFGPAFEDLIAQHGLEEKAKAADGNLFYEIVRNAYDPNQYRVNEKWRDITALQAWLAGFPDSFFATPEMKSLLVGEELQDMAGHIYPIPAECKKRAFGAVATDVAGSCDDVWAVVSNLSDCRWVIGCRFSTVKVQDDGILWTLNMADGRNLVRNAHLDLAKRQLVYSATETDYVGTVNVLPISNSTGCTLAYRFDVPKENEAVVQQVLDRFFDPKSGRVPALKKLFQ
jgi:quinol monooxygenase YgiN